jgi:hypothetical protein
MPRFLVAALAALLLLPAAATAKEFPRAHAVDLGSAGYGPGGLPDLDAKPRIPKWLSRWSSGNVHSADHWGNEAAVEQQFQDEHGHILTLATENPGVDLTPFANLLASTYHDDEIQTVHVFVTNRVRLEQICGGDAVACYGPDQGSSGVMIISYEDPDITHAVIHEYGHHVDNNTFNLAGINNCSIDGDGSRRWFFAREMRDRILDNLTCDPRGDWGTLLAEVYAEDYAQMVGIPPEEYHPAISVRRPTGAQLAALQKDLDDPFGPSSETVKGRTGASGTAVGKANFTVPVFVAARNRKGVKSFKVRGCNYQGFKDVFAGKCRIQVKTRRPRQKFSFKLRVF